MSNNNIKSNTVNRFGLSSFNYFFKAFCLLYALSEMSISNSMAAGLPLAEHASSTATSDSKIPACQSPKVNWNDYQWILIFGNGTTVCEEMLKFLKSRPSSAAPPVCAEERLPANGRWSRPEYRELNAAEKKEIIASVPKERLDSYVGHGLKRATFMRVIRADLTEEGHGQYYLAYSSSLDIKDKQCKQATSCAVNTDFSHQQIAIGDGSSYNYDLIAMNDTGTALDWSRVHASLNLMRGELVYYGGIPHWLSAPNWTQWSHDDFAHSAMRANDVYSAMFTLGKPNPAAASAISAKPTSLDKLINLNKRELYEIFHTFHTNLVSNNIISIC